MSVGSSPREAYDVVYVRYRGTGVEDIGSDTEGIDDSLERVRLEDGRMFFRRYLGSDPIQVLLDHHTSQCEPRCMGVQDRPALGMTMRMPRVDVGGPVLVRQGRGAVRVEELEQGRGDRGGEVVADVGE
jgi:hypothetical protein